MGFCHRLLSFLSSSSFPSIFFLTPVVSFCYFPGVFSFILSPLRVDKLEVGGGGAVCVWGGFLEQKSLTAGHRSIYQHQDFSQRDSLEANSETFRLLLWTKAERVQLNCKNLPFLFTPSSSFQKQVFFSVKLHEVIILSTKMEYKNNWEGHLSSLSLQPWRFAILRETAF